MIQLPTTSARAQAAPHSAPHSNPRPARQPTPASQRRYLSHSDALEEGGIPGLWRASTATILAMVVAFIAWSAVARIDEVSHSPGEVVPVVPIQRVQHLEGGIVLDILARDGELVDAGQPLLKLDPTPVKAELAQLRVRAAALGLDAERLKAFAEERPPNFVAGSDAPPSLVADQQAIYAGQLAARESQRRVADHAVEQRRIELATATEQEQRSRRSAAFLHQEAGMRGELLASGLSSRLQLLDVGRRVNEAEGEIRHLVDDQARLRQALKEAEQRRAEVDSVLAKDALVQMGQVMSELAQLKDQIAKQEDRLGRLVITAPVRGIVKGLQFTTVGGVVAPGAVVTELVPVGPRLIVEGRIEPKDAGSVRAGQRVAVKVSAYDFGRFGGIGGTVEGLSASTFVDDQNRPYYKARIALDRGYVGPDSARNPIVPGMTVQADITTGEKTLLGYLFRPVYVLGTQGFHER